MYSDGKGWVNEANRNDGYCPICNPKNYEAWEKKLFIQKQAKLALEKVETLRRIAEEEVLLADKQRATEVFRVPLLHN